VEQVFVTVPMCFSQTVTS